MSQRESPTSYNILNEARSALELAAELQKIMMRLKGAFMSEDGSSVDYTKLHQSDLFATYLIKTRELHGIDLQPLNPAQRKAFFINIYNALTIHALAARSQLPKSVLEVENFWKLSAYIIAGRAYSLDDIEHGILRRNKPHPSTNKSCFHDDDPRLAFIVDVLDARIHCALNCGAESCPPINVYSETNLDFALNAASKNYLNQEVGVDTVAKEIQLPALLKWYGCDAAADELGVVRWTIPFLSEGKAKDVQMMLAAKNSGEDVSISYTPYSWKLNSTESTGTSGADPC